MTNPFEFREIMQAAMKYDETREVEQVLADQETARKAAENNRKTRKNGDPVVAPVHKPVPQDEMAKVRAMLAAATPRSDPSERLASDPDE